MRKPLGFATHIVLYRVIKRLQLDTVCTVGWKLYDDPQRGSTRLVSPWGTPHVRKPKRVQVCITQTLKGFLSLSLSLFVPHTKPKASLTRTESMTDCTCFRNSRAVVAVEIPNWIEPSDRVKYFTLNGITRALTTTMSRPGVLSSLSWIVELVLVEVKRKSLVSNWGRTRSMVTTSHNLRASTHGTLDVIYYFDRRESRTVCSLAW